MSGNHTSPTHKPELKETVCSFSSDSRTLPGLGGGTDATANAANEQLQQAVNNDNHDLDNGSKVHPPGARPKHQQQQQQQQQLQHATVDGSPHSPGAASQLPLQSGKRAMHSSSSSGPPPKRPTTRTDEGGGGHPVKRVGTDTLLPPPQASCPATDHSVVRGSVYKRRRISGKQTLA